MPLVRITLFPERPDCILLTVPEGKEVDLPIISSPFEKAAISKSFGDLEIPHTIVETGCGRWAPAIKQMQNAEHALRRQEELKKQAIQATLLRGASSVSARTYGEMLLRKQEVDNEVRSLKAELGRAKAIAHTQGKFMPVKTYRAKEQKIVELQEESTALAFRLGEMKREEKRQNVKNSAEALRRAILEILPKDTQDKIRKREKEILEELEDEQDS